MRIRFPVTLTALAIAAILLPVHAQAAPTAAQLCESAITLAGAKFAQCRLTAESKAAKGSLTGQKLTDALTKCSTKLSDAYAKATIKYGMACAVTEPVAGFDGYLTQCSDDTAAAAGGASLPDYPVEIATCNADLSTCSGDLSTCTADLATAEGDLTTCQDDLTTCEGDLATCEAQSTALLLKTGQTTSYGAGSDGALQAGVARSYVDNGDGTITDTRTGLMWEKKSDDGSIHDKDTTYAWSTSGTLADGPVFTTFLATLNSGGGFAGHTDWRLPNEFELLSLQNFENVSPSISAAFNTGCAGGCTVLTCSCTSVSFGYWSSTSRAANGSFAWVLGFSEGHGVPGQKTVASSAVRAVRVP